MVLVAVLGVCISCAIKKKKKARKARDEENLSYIERTEEPNDFAINRGEAYVPPSYYKEWLSVF